MSGKREFMTTEMTPRAWRMIAYSCVGITLYGLTFLIDQVQNAQLSRIDRQLQQVSQLEALGEAPFQASTAPAAAPVPPAE
jgi:hypothetical protein